MALAFGVSATLGSLRYDTHVTALRISLGIAPRAGSATAHLPPATRFEATPGEAASITLTGENGEVPTFGGVVTRVSRALGSTVVTVGDALASLAAIRPGTTFEQQSTGSIVTAMANDAGIATGEITAGVDLLSYVADQGRTALEHAATLATWSGAFATSDADGKLTVRALPTGPAERALRYGREIAVLGVDDVTPAVNRVVVGFGPAGNISAPNAHLHTTSVVPDTAPAPGPDTIRRAAAVLRTAQAANDATAALATRNVSRRVSAACWLQPELRPGSLIEIADAPQPDSLGPWFLTGVVHEIGPGPRGVTRLTGEALGAGGGLLGALLGAVGGLL